MSVVKIPPDGAAKRFKASQENSVANKQTMVARQTDLRKKIEVADKIKQMKESDGWKLVELWYTNKWAFKNIMNEFTQENENYKRMMYQREAIEMLEGHLKWLVEQGDMARNQLNMEERLKEKNG